MNKENCALKLVDEIYALPTVINITQVENACEKKHLCLRWLLVEMNSYSCPCLNTFKHV